jgi:uncharacterized protein with GYD domain
MPTYIVLTSWTEQGIHNVKDSVKRAQAFRDLGTKMGFKVKDLYWTTGRHDLVSICEAPDDTTISAGMLATASLGNVRSETLRAFTAPEMEAIIKRLP